MIIIDSFSTFNKTLLNVLNKRAPLKKKRPGTNHASYLYGVSQCQKS